MSNYLYRSKHGLEKELGTLSENVAAEATNIAKDMIYMCEGEPDTLDKSPKTIRFGSHMGFSLTPDETEDALPAN